MKIELIPKSFSFQNKYDVHVNGSLKYHTIKKFFTWQAEINVFNINSETPVCTLKRKWKWDDVYYHIIINSVVYEFVTISIWYSHYACQVNNDKYDIYAHKGRKYSIFKNDNQIASWDKSVIIFADQSDYKLIADDDCDSELLICFCLIIDNSLNTSMSDNMLVFDFGNVGFGCKKYDVEWKPKIINSAAYNST